MSPQTTCVFPDVFNFAGIQIQNETLASATFKIIASAEKGIKCVVVTPNVDHVLRLQKDPLLKRAYDAASYVFADGMPVVWASRLLGHPLAERVTGADLLPALVQAAAPKRLKVMLFGAPEGHAEKAKQMLNSKFPGCLIEAYCPPYGFEKTEEENLKALKAISNFHPDLLFVGLGSPKQEVWVQSHLNQIQAHVILNVGAAISFAAGEIGRAPSWMQKSGTEWIFRMFSEPRRLIPRYLSNFVFFRLLVRELLQQKIARR
jgi:N-acetylglucosaminyldiphosphoundecaprenol N-acetyl-beta-D-mannosaminyltransferase